jgi:hypothetical protein
MTDDTALVFGRDFDLGFLVRDDVYIPRPLRPGEMRYFGAAMKQVAGLWTLGDMHESESGMMSLALEHTSLDDTPLHAWSFTREEFLHTDPETLTRQIPQALRQQYAIDELELAKALARKQREVEKPYNRFIREAGRKVKLTGEQPVLVDEIAPKIPEPQAYGTDSELFERIVDFYKANVIFAEPETYVVVTSWTLLTWRLEDTTVAPYLYVTAPRGHGKTRLLETINQVARRPLVASYATRAGAIRAIDSTNATLLLDEAEHYINPHERQSSDLAAILNAGYRRGARAIMVADVIETLPDGTHRSVKKPVALDTFGAKVIASRRDIFDTLEDRSVQIIMPKHGRNLGPIDEKYGEGLRGQLAQYRADCLERKQPLRANLPETGDARLSEIVEPLYAVTPEQHRGAYHIIMDREKRLRLERIQESYEYAVLEGFDAVVLDDTEDGSLVLTEAVVDAYNQRHASKPTTARSIGRTLARLGFKADRDEIMGPAGRATRRGYRLKRALLDRLKTEYGFDSPKQDASTASTASTTLDSILPPQENPPTPNDADDTTKNTTLSSNDADDADDAESSKETRST